MDRGRLLRSPGQPAPRIPPVGALLLARRPAAVARLVVAVPIDPVDRVVEAGAWAHVGEEVFELQPPLADDYAATAVALEGRVSWVRAATAHRGPGSVGRRVRPAMLVTGRATAAVGRQLRLGCFRVLSSESRRSGLKAPRIARSMSTAGATRSALQGLALLLGQRFPLPRFTDPEAPLFGHGMAGIRAVLRARLSDLGVTLAGASGQTFGHAQNIAQLREASL